MDFEKFLNNLLNSGMNKILAMKRAMQEFMFDVPARPYNLCEDEQLVEYKVLYCGSFDSSYGVEFTTNRGFYVFTAF